MVSLLKDIQGESTAHAQGEKFVFASVEKNALTQFAYGVLKKDEQSGSHRHLTMDEYFYFIKGIGTYEIDDSIVELVPTTFVKIPAGTFHNLINESDEPLEFVYFGVAL